MDEQDDRFKDIRYVLDGDYGVAIQTITTKQGYKRIKIAQVWRSPDGPRFSTRPLNEKQKEKQRVNPNITVSHSPTFIENLCAALLLEVGKKEGAATDTAPETEEDKTPF